MITTFDVPNLDCEESEELAKLEKVFRDLADYAHYKQQAMRYRLEGKITAALQREQACDCIYGQLPQWARW